MEMTFAGFVTEQSHTQQTAQTAEQCGNGPDAPFRDPAKSVNCIVLVHKHNYKTKDIDYKQVQINKLHTKTFLEGIIVKKCWILLAVVLLLSGCGQKETFETVSDEVLQPVDLQVQEIYLELPENTHVQAMDTQNPEKLYFCGDMTVCVQTLDGGDLDRTLRVATGYSRESVQLMESDSPFGKSYECAWSAAGEGGLQIGRTKILDDGNYHYALTIMLPEGAMDSNRESLQKMLDSFGLMTEDINTGS